MSFAWLVVGLLWVVGMMNYLDRLTITTMRDSVKADIPMTDAQFGLVTSVFLWVYALLSPAAGYLADRFSRTGVIVGSLFVWSVVTWMTGHCHTVGQLLVVRALMGIAEACYIPAALALIADYHRGTTRSLATGIHMSGIYAGMALGGIGGYLAESIGWRTAFTIFGLGGVVYGGVLAFVLRDPPRPESAAAASAQSDNGVTLLSALRALFTQPSYYAIVAHWTLLALAGWGFSGWLPTYLKEHFHMGQGAAGMSATGYVQITAFIGILVGGIWADAWSRRNARGRLFVPAFGFLAAGPALFMAASTDVFALAIAGLMVYGLARGFSDANMMPILCQVVDPRYRATGYGIMNCFSCLTGGVMIYASGALKDRNVDLGTVFQYAAAGLVLAAIVLLLVRPMLAENSSGTDRLAP
jgi:MFS family permease